MSAWEIIFTVLGLLGIGGGATAWFTLRPQMQKLRAEAKAATVTAATAEDTAEDEHLKTIINYLVRPLKDEVGELRTELEAVKGQVRAQNRKYRMAFDWIRSVMAWQRAFHPNIDPPMPTFPIELDEDL